MRISNRAGSRFVQFSAGFVDWFIMKDVGLERLGRE